LILLQSSKQAILRIDKWDVLVFNASNSPKPATILDADLDDWDKCYRVNIRGTIQSLQALLQKRNAEAAVISSGSGVSTRSQHLWQRSILRAHEGSIQQDVRDLRRRGFGLPCRETIYPATGEYR